MYKVFSILGPLILFAVFVLPVGLIGSGAQVLETDQVVALPQVRDATGPRVESSLVDRHMGYTVTLKQFNEPLLSADGFVQFELSRGCLQTSSTFHRFSPANLPEAARQ